MTVALLSIVIGPALSPFVVLLIVMSALIVCPFVLTIELLPKNGYRVSESALV